MGVNKAILIGNLGKDPELKYTPTGQPVTTFSLATTEKWNDKSGQKQERTEWHNIVVWGKLAELCNQYLKKGRSAFIEGRITTRSWDDRDGVKKHKTEIVATTVQFLGGPNSSSGGPSDSYSGADSGPGQGYESSSPSPASPSSGVEEDLPF